jgi:NADH-quinone oxidoreductase subunit L
MSELYLKIIPLFPILAFFANGLILRTQAKNSIAGFISFLGTFISFIFVCLLYPYVKEGPVSSQLWPWMQFSDFTLEVKFLMDNLSFILAVMVTGIGSLITLFAIGYMDHDERPGKFFSYLSLFIFSMLLLTLSENFLVLFFGWEGVGLCSYLLIGFWYTDIEKAMAGRKAFVANRVGDLGVVLGIVGFAMVFKTISFVDLKSVGVDTVLANKELLTISSLFLVLGATGKSAQIPLFVWLPDAMSGPTPVSALIHAATMVTAGIFMLCRISFVITHLPTVLEVIAWIGSLTALMAAIIAVTQSDIKKVLAYSTVSQIGFMMAACGAGAFSSGMFHVFTHAFFKALLFLGAGAVIYCLHHEQNMFHMGSLKNKMPKTYWCFVAALLAIAGVPMFSGFFSKDEIMWMVFNRPVTGQYLFAVLLTAATLTSFYMTRLVCLTFLSKDKTHHDPKHPIHDAPPIMIIPLGILAVCSIFVGYLGMPHFMSHDNARAFQLFVEKAVTAPKPAIYDSHTEHLLMALTIGLTFIAMFLAYFIYVKNEESNMADKFKLNVRRVWNLSNNKFFVDEIYATLIINPIKTFAQFLVDFVEKYVIDGIVRTIGVLNFQTSVFLKSVRGIELQSNIFFMIMGLTIILTILFSSLMVK